MRKLILRMSMSLDGFVGVLEGPNNWMMKGSDESSRAWALEKSWDTSLIIMGRKSFESMAPFWISTNGPFAEVMNKIPKAVFTKSGFKGLPATPDQTAAEVSWAETTILTGDLADTIKNLKSEEGKPIVAIAGAEFARNLIATGLVDEFHIAVFPVVLGKGFPIFNGIANSMNLKLIEAKSFPGGVVGHIYQPA